MLEVGNFTPPENCEFRMPLVLHVSAKRELRLNLEPETREQLSKRLTLILRERIQPVLYVLPDGDLTMQEFAEILELVRESNSNVSIRLITCGNLKYSCIDYQYGPAA
jgi:biopolymer transport protein ExbD